MHLSAKVTIKNVISLLLVFIFGLQSIGAQLLQYPLVFAQEEQGIAVESNNGEANTSIIAEESTENGSDNALNIVDNTQKEEEINDTTTNEIVDEGLTSSGEQQSEGDSISTIGTGTDSESNSTNQVDNISGSLTEAA